MRVIGLVLLAEIWAIAAALAWIGHTSRHKRRWFIPAVLIAAAPVLQWVRILVPDANYVFAPFALFPVAVLAVVGAAWHYSREQVRAASEVVLKEDA